MNQPRSRTRCRTLQSFRRWSLWLLLIWTATLSCCVWTVVQTATIKDPYEVLGIKKSATIPEIKRAHKNLVKLWHPDKKRHNSENRYLEINHAYELLMDPERREQFDKHRITEDTPNFRYKPDYSEYRRHDLEHLDSVMFSQVTNQTESESKIFHPHHLELFHSQTVTAKGYASKVVADSYTFPQLVLFYSDDLETCPHCSSGAVIWHRITAELQPLGIHLSTVNVDKERALSAKLGMQSKQLPSVIGITDGNVRMYKDQQLSLRKMSEFLRKMLNYERLIVQLKDDDYELFLNGWLQDNRVRVLFVSPDTIVKLRYLVTAFKYREYAACAHVTINSHHMTLARQMPFDPIIQQKNVQTESYLFDQLEVNQSQPKDDHHKSFAHVFQPTVRLSQKYKLSGSMRWMLIFGENTSWPEAALSSQELRTTLMWEMLEANKFLTLPRVTSQHLFDQLCPVELMRSKRMFCTMLITPNASPEWEPHRQAMRKFIKQSGLSRNRFRFMYLSAETQKDFIRALLSSNSAVDQLTSESSSADLLTEFGNGDNSLPISLNMGGKNHNQEQSYSDSSNDVASNEPIPNPYSEIKAHPDDLRLRVLVLARAKWEHILFEYLPVRWNVTDTENFNRTQELLLAMLRRLYTASGNGEFTHELNTISLIDENAKSLMGRIWQRLWLMADHMSDHLTKRELLPIFSVVLTVLFIALICYTMKYLVKLEEQQIEDTYRKLGKRRPDFALRQPPPATKLLIHELRGETYNGLVRLLKPGCRTIVLLCDMSSRNKLLPKFYKAVYPYRKNKTLMFAFLMLEKNIDWYKKILEQALDKQKELNLNPKNCIGTVLSLNGFRKYFCVFHAKHTEARNSQRNSMVGTGEGSESDNSDIESGNLLQHGSRKCSLLNENVLLDDFLLDGLSGWLEKLFNADTHRYYIAYWPDQMK